MEKPPTNIKPSVLAVSAILGVLFSSRAMAISTIVSGSIASLNNATSYDLISITNTGTILGTNYGINNQGDIGTLTNNGTITASFYGIYSYLGSIGTLTNYGSISGSDTGVYNDSFSTITSLTNYGTISGGEEAIYNYGSTIGTLVNSGLITSGNIGIYNNGGTINTLINAGTISAGDYGIYNDNEGFIGTLTNSAYISDTPYAIYNYGGTIGTLTNSGSISDATYGIYNDVDSTIGNLINSGSIGASSAGIYNYSATIGTLTNSGTLSANDAIANLGGRINILNNSVVIVGGESGIYNSGSTSTIGVLNNTGTISAEENGITNSGSISTLSNSGLILGYVGLDNSDGTIGTLINSGNLKGYSYAINNDGGTIGPITNSGTILGNIYSTSGLTIAGGAGTTVGALSGYTNNNNNLTGSIGSIDITSGNLIFSGGNLILNDNVTLSSGSLNNTGSQLYVGNPITINGNYTQSASASLNNYVFSESVYGQLLVTGSASVASGSSVNLIGYQYGFATGQRYVVISAATGNYNESSLHYAATGYTGSIVGTSVANGSNTDLVLTLVGTPTTPGNPTPGNPTPGNPTTDGPSLATTPNAVASLGGLQRYSGTSNAALLNLYNASLAIGSTAEGNRAGEQLSPNQNASAGFATSSATFDMINVIGNHLGSVDAIKVAQADGSSSGISAGDEAPQQAGWGQIFGGRAKQDMTDDISGYHADYSGAVVGYDRAISDDWRLGGALSYTYTSVDGTDNVHGSSSHVKSYGLTAYASYVAPTWYSNLYAGVLEQRYSTQRRVSFTGYEGVADGSFSGQQYAFKAEFGYPIALSRSVSLTPIANASYSYLYQNGYTESGGNGAALQVDSAHIDTIKSGLGAKLETTLSTGWGDVVPYVQMMWNHQYNGNRMTINSAYAADTAETSFISKGSSPVKDAADLTVGTTLLRSRNTSLTAYYDLGIAPNYTNQSVSLRFKQLF